MPLLFNLFFLLLLFPFHDSLIQCSELNDEGLALLRFREGVVRDPLNALSSRDRRGGNVNPCSWFGVRSSDGKVVALNMGHFPVHRVLLQAPNVMPPTLSVAAHLPPKKKSPPTPSPRSSNNPSSRAPRKGSQADPPSPLPSPSHKHHSPAPKKTPSHASPVLSNSSSESFPASESSHKSHGVLIGLSVVGGSMVVLVAVAAFIVCRSSRMVTVKPWATGLSLSLQKAFVSGLASFLCYKKSLCYTRTRWFILDSANQRVETFLESHGSLAPQRYTYTDIKKMTNSFKEKLGEGGFGGVYKGKLLDGRLVAVKLLKHSKGNGDDFINEVASISRTNHVNVVTLLGFCCVGQKRALVYEFMVNGSLDKFINDGSQSLPLETLFIIALGIARGLDYLHQGCKTRILHFDIKPHNILLDKEFCPKISDFGLAKVSQQNKQSKVSMSGTRGTIGYISPEMFCRSFGDVSHKSDVYSYGMMVLEMIGSRKRRDANGGSSSEMIFPQWIYEQLENGDAAEVDGITLDLNEEEKGLKRKMIIVSLWCIQTVPTCRPSMSNVLRMLEGGLELIQIPPMPSLTSPPRTRTI